GNFFQVNVQAYAGTASHFPESPENSSLSNIMHSRNAPLSCNPGLRKHRKILVKILGSLYKRRGEFFQKLCFLFFCCYRCTFQANPLSDHNILARSYSSCSQHSVLFHLSHASKRNQRLLYHMGNLCVSAHDFHVQLFTGPFYSPHHLFKFLFPGIRSEKDRQHNSQRVCSGSSQIIGCNMDTVPSNVLRSSGNRVCRKYKNLSLSQFHYGTVLPHCRAYQHLISSVLYLFQNGTYQHRFR